MEPEEGTVAIDIPLVPQNSAEQELGALSDEPAAAYNFTFFRVPPPIRERYKHLYKPQTVAIGPYGRRDEPPLQEMEWIKERYRESFRSRSDNMSINDLNAEIRKLEPEARRRYFEPVKLNPKKFTEMLLLDGCFILEFLIKWKLGDEDSLSAAAWSEPFVRGDLLLLENQIPLFVLDKLFELVKPTLDSNIPSSLMELLVEFLQWISYESPEEDIESSKKDKCCAEGTQSSEEEVEGDDEPRLTVPGESKNFQHLLHLYYHRYVTKPQTDLTGCGTIPKWLRQSTIFAPLLSKICRPHKKKRLLRTIPSTTELPHKDKRFPTTIPSATELLEAGVTIENQNQNQNQRCLSAFLKVEFNNGVLRIPFLSVDSSTLPRFSNLVAFEQCGKCKPGEDYMTSYAAFMDCLINRAEDVAILHKLGILENNLASDEDLATFFNQLADYVTMDFQKHYLAKLYWDVREYCGSPWPKWRAKLVRDYFGNPWAILSLIAAAVLLILTILQTVYTVYPYYHPRK